MASPPAPRKWPAPRRKSVVAPDGAPRPATASPVQRPAFRIVECDAIGLSEAMLSRAAELGFDTVLLRGSVPLHPPFDLAIIRNHAKAANAANLRVFLDIHLYQVSADWPLADEQPTWFRHIVADQWPVDPRRDLLANELLPRFDHPDAQAGLARALGRSLTDALDAGVSGFAINWPQRIPSAASRAFVDAVRDHARDAVFMAWAPGLSTRERNDLRDAGFNASMCSLPWWDFRAPWFAEELEALRGCGKVVAPVERPDGRDERAIRAFTRATAVAALVGDGWMLRHSNDILEHPSPFDNVVRSTNATFASDRGARSVHIGAPWSRVDAWRAAGVNAAVTLINSDLDHHASIPSAALETDIGLVVGSDTGVLAPGEVRRIELPPRNSVAFDIADEAVESAIASARVVIESVSPLIDDGRFPAKRVVGDSVIVEADVFADGHPVLAVRLLWRPSDTDDWQRVRMRALGNDRWRAEFPLRRQGPHEFTIEAGIDEFAGLRSGLDKKVAAGQNVALDVEEARLFIESAAKNAPSEFRTRLRTMARDIATARDPAARVLAPDCAALMSEASAPAFLSRAPVTGRVIAERRAACFASWYELFPRSMGRDGKHGTLNDVIGELPRIQAMGFNVLYFPPIHPIGLKNRKGKNNSLNADASQPGSPYAIGGVDGGHDAIHPELGTLDDFLKLVSAAREHGLELALDFAVQCAPDHPWITQHPEWFAWRPDGSMRYAENPPKKYEDIVNVDFYADDAKPALWLALRNVVAFWLAQGVKIFRVDNPHTKPLPFWEWLIADMRARDPDVMFLSEAFTRPKLMYRLAKIGFSQSYTYFTWRNTRYELETYLKELNTAPVSDFFRPHFFVNTPDIDPYFLQTSGRAGFLIRAALATTLSGLWGMYSGFELCEAAALPGKEEYLDSEKYELRPRDWNAPGNINAEITQLNRIRRANPALHTHLGVTFYTCGNDNILYFGKSTPSRDNVVLVAINLDPHHAQEADIEIPLWEFGLDDNAVLITEELTTAHAFDWRGKQQRIRLEPATPYRIWRVRSERDR